MRERLLSRRVTDTASCQPTEELLLHHHQMTFSKGHSDQRSSAAARRRSSCGAKGRKSAEERISVVMTISWALMTFQWALITFSPEVAVRYAFVCTILLLLPYKNNFATTVQTLSCFFFISLEISVSLTLIGPILVPF